MGSATDSIDDALAAWLVQQRLFFVATAPLAADGHVNVSPKGLDSLRILDARTVAWLDLTGSGAETIAHLRENGRITLMFCAFDGPPRIVRIYGRGESMAPSDPEFAVLRPRFPEYPAARGIVRVRVDRVSQSCGYCVPEFTFVRDRDHLNAWWAEKGEVGAAAFRRKHNRHSIDGLPALDAD
ncbi:MAG: pyridoxamine 5'-phosphate oxidase family protein [Planctomycetes bacterium]|nr:pyridoxamine 5'-phosphate oxidase family protein [Planctomycetota bacterium]